ncbi:MAG TPA: glycine cleavage system aminomethyltransferase GcvT [Kiritimatiellia bacterium]|nr:glycine cleavage system aminomethyltransferase GcvT [Kiritimatiellia bacterium]
MMTAVYKTPLHETHLKLGARMAPFGGWDMPIQYEGILAEHEFTRRHCGLFDICHMGELELSGPTAEQDLERLLTQSVKSIAVGQCKYGFLLRDDGGVIDDLTCYRLDREHFMLVVNAGTCAGDADWIANRISPATRFHNISAWTGKLDIQGPDSREVMEAAFGTPLPDLKYFHFTRLTLMGASCILSRTGYTGEWGYELYMPIEATVLFWNKLMETGKVKPVGLGARDTLRLEVGYPLYGHELSKDRTPVSAFGGNFIEMSKDFIGRSGVARELDKGPRQKMIGLALSSKRAARTDDIIWSGPRKVGVITSGSLAPSLGHAIALGYVDADVASIGGDLEVEVKGTRLPARLSSLPFYTAGTARKKRG